MKPHGLKLRSAFLAGCIILALPGLVGAGFYAVQAWAAWQAARAAATGARAAGEAMRAAATLMAERGRLQDAAFLGQPDADVFMQAAAASDKALDGTTQALRDAGLPATSAGQMRESLAAAREKGRNAVRKRASIRVPLEQYSRLVEGLEEDASHVEREITLASPSTGLIVGLARGASELRGIAGQRGVLLNLWFSGNDLVPAQKDELLALTGRLAGAWDRFQRGVRASGLPPAPVEAIERAGSTFLLEKEPWYRELVKAAATGAERPLDYRRFRAWHAEALESLLPPHDVLVAQAEAQGIRGIETAWHGLLASVGVALVSLVLVAAALLILLRSLIEPVRGMTAAMTALATGNLDAAPPPDCGLREISAQTAAVAVFRDNLVCLHRREAELEQANLRFETALENMSQGLCHYDDQDRLQVFNRRFCTIFRLDYDRVQPGITFEDVTRLVFDAGNYPNCTVDEAVDGRLSWRQRRDAGTVLLSLTEGRVVSAALCPMANGWVVTYEDVTERHRSEERLSHMARHDALTGLPNRVLLREHMERVLPGVRRGSQLAVLCLDLDGFKGVNDTLGHPAGDTLLRLVACRMQDNTRETDFVARLGGDEFAIVQAGAEQPSDAMALAERLVAALRIPFDIGGQHVEIGTRIGVVLADGAHSPDDLLRSADIALYRAKADGRGTWCLFEQDMDTEMQRRHALEVDLRRALAEAQFELFYQPLVEAGTKALTGFEALVRWRHPERGMVSPGEFIPLAEETGLVRPLGAWVLAQACADATRWPEHVKVAVNLSPVQFAKGNLVREVEQALAASGLAPHRLELEITESVLLQDNKATLSLLHQLRGLGARISMDDFGTGYSSLSYLRLFPFDKIKVDQSFIRTLASEGGSIEIVRAVVGLGKALGMTVLAEGVETHEQLSILRNEGCNELQGYLFSRPCPVQDVPDIIAAHPPSKTQPVHGPVLVIDNAATNRAMMGEASLAMVAG